jgi:1-acyl-sn-glycerol-3-phosphate acyltransferase
VLPSLGVLAHGALETAKISLPAVWRAQRGTLTDDFCDEKLRSWSRRLLDHVEVDLEVRGLEHLLPGVRSYVVMSNHQSLYDIPALFVALPLSLRMAAKAELFSVPIWGRAMTASGFVKIDRKDPERARQALAEAGKTMKARGLSLSISPEGTRSPDGVVRRFKRGGFEVARATGLPILPVAIDGTRHILPKGAIEVNRGQKVRVTVLEPLLAPNFEALDALRESVRASIEQAIRRP